MIACQAPDPGAEIRRRAIEVIERAKVVAATRRQDLTERLNNLQEDERDIDALLQGLRDIRGSEQP